MTSARRTALIDIKCIKRATRLLADIDGLYQPLGLRRSNAGAILGLRLPTTRNDQKVSIAVIRALAASARSAGLGVTLDGSDELVIELPPLPSPQLGREQARRANKMLTVVACANGDIMIHAIAGGAILDIQRRIALPSGEPIVGLDALVIVVGRCIEFILDIAATPMQSYLARMPRDTLG